MSSTLKELDRVNQVISAVSFPGYTFQTGVYAPNCFFLQVRYSEPDVMTGVNETQTGRQWAFPAGQTTGQIVQTMFKAILTSLEHRAREHFLYRGKPVLQPHLDVDQIWAMLPEQDRHEGGAPFQEPST
jgi:hypothetical protein